jgi:tetratricopeptide (TPR) repeat protein
MKAKRLPKDGYSYDGPPGSSSSSGDAGSPAGASSSRHDDDDVPPTTEAPDAPVKATKLKDLGSSGSFSAAHEKLEKTRFDDDLKVGKFYMEDGNTQGAYLRYKDAVAHVPDDPDALFGLAQAADKLKKRDEAVANYRATIEADPGGDHVKAAKAALKDLGVAAK